jgi:hypothetical protein
LSGAANGRKATLRGGATSTLSEIEEVIVSASSHNDKLAEARKQIPRLQKLLALHTRVNEECERRGMDSATPQQVEEMLGKEEYERLTKSLSEDKNPLPATPQTTPQTTPPTASVKTRFKDTRTANLTELFQTKPGFQFLTIGTFLSVLPEDGFWAIRGKAIQAYATLEQSLCTLFSHLSSIPMNLAGIVFFKIYQSDVVRTVLDDLMKKKYGSTYSLFWNSFSEMLRGISIKRNQIVHWNVVHTSDNCIVLILPDMLGYNPNSPKSITGEDCITFIDACLYMTRHLTAFIQTHTPESPLHSDQVGLQALRDIFSRPIVFPPLHNNPLYRSSLEPESQHPPSPP